MKKIICCVFLVLTIYSCKSTDDELETNLFLSQAQIVKSNSVTSVGVELKDKIYFKKGFWKLMFKKYPQAMGLIFTSDTLHTWNYIKFGKSYDKNIDTLKEYQFRNIDSATILRINNLLPLSAYKNEKVDSTNRYNSSTKYYELNTSKVHEYNKLRQIFNDTSYTFIEIYCDKDVLKSIINHKYAL